jgi:hypothetical protein
MAAHFLGQPAYHPVMGFRRAVGTELAVFVALLGIMTALARVRIGGTPFEWSYERADIDVVDYGPGLGILRADTAAVG